MPTDKIDWDDKLPSGEIPYFKVTNGARTPIKKDRDYTFISRDTQIHLDEIVIPTNFIAIGENYNSTVVIGGLNLI